MKFHATNHPKKSRSRLARLVVVIVVIAAGLGTFAALDAFNIIDLPFFLRDKKVITPRSDNDINYGPPTEQEKQETETFKEKQGSESTQPPAPTPPGQKKAVTPTITTWGYNKLSAQAEVSGYVADVIENGGTCTLTLKKAGQTVTEQKSAIADAQTTSCGLITVARSRLSPGSWTATLSYSSATAEGTSAGSPLEVE